MASLLKFIAPFTPSNYIVRQCLEVQQMDYVLALGAIWAIGLRIIPLFLARRKYMACHLVRRENAEMR